MVGVGGSNPLGCTKNLSFAPQKISKELNPKTLLKCCVFLFLNTRKIIPLPAIMLQLGQGLSTLKRLIKFKTTNQLTRLTHHARLRTQSIACCDSFGCCGHIFSHQRIECTPKKPDTPETNKVQQTLVSVQNIQARTHRVTLTSQGFVKPELTSTLNSQVAGEIIYTSAKFKLGQFFQKGELIAKIDPLAYEVKLANAEHSLAQAQEELLQTLAKQKIAQLDLDPEKTSQLGLHIPQVETARAKVKAKQWQLKQAQDQLAATQIFAPFTATLKKNI